MSSIYMMGDVNITFLHIPKTGGTSITKWLKTIKKNSYFKEYGQHPKLSEIMDNLPRNCSPNFTFTVVRNPWDSIVSLYCFIDQYGKKLPNIRKEFLTINNFEEFPTFDQFVFSLRTLKGHDAVIGGGGRLNGPQNNYIDRPIDYIIKHDNLTEDFKKIQDHVRNWNPLPTEFKTVRGEYSDYYTTDTKDFIYNMFKDDIDRWDFKF